VKEFCAATLSSETQPWRRIVRGSNVLVLRPTAAGADVFRIDNDQGGYLK
jgi:hypothetical protein